MPLRTWDIGVLLNRWNFREVKDFLESTGSTATHPGGGTGATRSQDGRNITFANGKPDNLPAVTGRIIIIERDIRRGILLIRGVFGEASQVQ